MIFIPPRDLIFTYVYRPSKADGFGRSPSGKKGGAIERKALWKLRRGAGKGTFTFAGRVRVASYRADGLPEATIAGDIVELEDAAKFCESNLIAFCEVLVRFAKNRLRSC